jgi:aminotransferase in exopolysaccharide biosynthesis
MTDQGKIVDFIRGLYPNMDPVLLHCPNFVGNEKKYLAECIDTNYVSYVGRFVTAMEDKIKEITGSHYAVAMVNGTAALQMALVSCGVKPEEEVVTQSLTFVATAAAIVHAGACPAFVDVDRETLGMSPDSLHDFLQRNSIRKEGKLMDKTTGRTISAVVPVHIFGHPVRIHEIKAICDEYGLMLIEDAAEALGSYRDGKHAGTFGLAGILSFNGNKLVTTGGGGMLITDNESIATRARYISTTAKRPHAWEFFHEEVGYNLRMPSLNAAEGFAQLEYLDRILSSKREVANLYQEFFAKLGISIIKEPAGCSSNYWLNAIVLNSREERDEFLTYMNSNKVQTRPVWTLMHKMPPYRDYPRTELPVAEWYEDRIVNIPSSMRA